MKKKGTALFAGFFPQYVHVKKFNINQCLQNQVKIMVSSIIQFKPVIQD